MFRGFDWYSPKGRQTEIWYLLLSQRTNAFLGVSPLLGLNVFRNFERSGLLDTEDAGIRKGIFLYVLLFHCNNVCTNALLNCMYIACLVKNCHYIGYAAINSHFNNWRIYEYTGWTQKHSLISSSYKIKGKDKAIPLQAWTGPEGSRRLRLPDFKTIGIWRW